MKHVRPTSRRKSMLDDLTHVRVWSCIDPRITEKEYAKVVVTTLRYRDFGQFTLYIHRNILFKADF